MADSKYTATMVALNAAQRELLEKAVKKAEEDLGIHLSRSQVVAMLAAKYLKEVPNG